MRLRFQILVLHLAIAALAPGAWTFWRFAAWRSRLQTELNNLTATHEQ